VEGSFGFGGAEVEEEISRRVATVWTGSDLRSRRMRRSLLTGCVRGGGGGVDDADAGGGGGVVDGGSSGFGGSESSLLLDDENSSVAEDNW